MGTTRYVVLGLGPARCEWTRRVAQWAASGTLPVEFIPCLSLEELTVRLHATRPVSGVIIDQAVANRDRDVTDLMTSTGVPKFIVTHGDDTRSTGDTRSWDAVLPPSFDQAALLDALAGTASMIPAPHPTRNEPPDPTEHPGEVVAVTGPGGAGTSTVAASVAQGLSADRDLGSQVVLADLALWADQAMLHDIGDVMPGLPELAGMATRSGPPVDEIRALTYRVQERQYRLLLGLRRHREWASIRPTRFESTLAALRRAFRVVVADITGDFEGAAETGSDDVEDRNSMARTTARAADPVLVVGQCSVKGLHSMVRMIGELHDLGISSERVLPVLNHAPRSPRARSDLRRALHLLVGDAVGDDLHFLGPIFVPTIRRIDDLQSTAAPMPAAMSRTLGRAVRARWALVVSGTTGPAPSVDPVPVQPGSLGSLFDGLEDGEGAA